VTVAPEAGTVTPAAKPAAAHVAKAPTVVTLPAAVNAGGGSSAPTSDFPVWGAAMIVAAALAAAGAGVRLGTSSHSS
jgi:hypothetical protein